MSNFSQNGAFSPALSRSTTLDSAGGPYAVKKEGLVQCKEDGFGGMIWKNKWLILRESELDFQKSRDGKITLTIDLKWVTGVSRCDNIPITIEINRVANPSTNPGMPLRDLPQKTIYLKFKNDEELYEWQDGIYTRCPAISGVSNPTNFSHRVHVGFDPTNGNFVGLPVEWEKLLTASAITKEDYQKNPQAVIEVLEFYSDINKRNQNPQEYPSLMPTPPIHTSNNMQLGHGGGGTAIAPPRPAPPNNGQRQMSYGFQQGQQQPQQGYVQNSPSRSQSGTPVSQRMPSGLDPRAQQTQPDMRQQQPGGQSKMAMPTDMRRMMEEEAQKVKEAKAQKERERARAEEEEQNRRDMEAYNAAIPKVRTPLAKQELRGYGATEERYNPVRNAPTAPSSARQQPQQGSLRNASATRQAPRAPAHQNDLPSPGPRAPFAQKPSSSRDQSPSNQGSLRTPVRTDQQQRLPSPSSRQPGSVSDRNPSPSTRTPNGSQFNGSGQTPSPSRLPGPIQPTKPLNVQTKPPAPAAKDNVPDAVKQAEIALTSKKPTTAKEREKEVRMSSMSENEVMEKLKSIATKQNPADSYQKQKKIGQGASGSVYVAKILPNAASAIAREAYRTHGPKGQVAIKTMDLRNQPRKELIVNEIIVMKESMHPNIVNYLDAFLLDGNNELWVVMEFMEGGALTDIIDSNPVITEDQIAAICREVS